jgi:hypothetical protein
MHGANPSPGLLKNHLNKLGIAFTFTPFREIKYSTKCWQVGEWHINITNAKCSESLKIICIELCLFLNILTGQICQLATSGSH